MAWLQNLSGQAEKLLNKIDQKAANVLQDANFQQKQGSTKLLQDPDVCVAIPETYYIPENDIQEEGSTLLPVISNEICVPNIKEPCVYEGEISEDFNWSPAESPTKNIVKDNSSALLGDDSKRDLSVSSKSDSVLHSFSTAEDIQKYLERISKLEFENEDLSRQLLNVQHLYSEIRNENATIKSNLERANEMVSVAENEMEQYKARAHRILEEKERLINVKASPETHENSEETIYVNYNEELKNELKFQQEKNEEFKEKISALTSEIIGLQQQYVVMQNTLQKFNQKTETDLFSERRMLLSIDEELKTKSQELNQVRQELVQKSSEIILKSQEVEHLKSQLKQCSSVVNNNELEYRVQNLTQTLMMKQNKIETITSERNALRIQLEKLEAEHHRYLLQTRSSQHKVVHVNNSEDVKPQIPMMMRVSPLDAGVTRRVKHAYSSLDALSIRTGVFLRRYPGVRVFVFCYMVLLHLWVLIILFNYAPNMK